MRRNNDPDKKPHFTLFGMFRRRAIRHRYHDRRIQSYHSVSSSGSSSSSDYIPWTDSSAPAPPPAPTTPAASSAFQSSAVESSAFQSPTQAMVEQARVRQAAYPTFPHSHWLNALPNPSYADIYQREGESSIKFKNARINLHTPPSHEIGNIKVWDDCAIMIRAEDRSWDWALARVVVHLIDDIEGLAPWSGEDHNNGSEGGDEDQDEDEIVPMVDEH